MTFSVSRVPLGGGGWLIGGHIAPNGNKLARTDVYNGYWWDATDAKWYPLFTATNAASYLADITAFGLWDAAITNSGRVYAICGGYLYRRDGVTHGSTTSWTRTALARFSGYSGGNTDSNNGDSAIRTTGQHLVVDPNNDDVVYVHTDNNGVQVTRDGGTTFSAIASITQGTSIAGAGLAIDGTATTTVGGVTCSTVVIVPSFGNGVWRSADGGQTWTQIANGTASPLSVKKGRIAPDGAYWCTDYSNVWKYASGSWTNVFTGTVWSVMPHPTTTGLVYWAEDSSRLHGTTDNGTTTIEATNFWMGTTGTVDIGWLANSDNGTYRSNGDMQIDASDGKCYFYEGIAVWEATLPTTYTSFTWASQTKGIEELVGLDAIRPPGGTNYIINVADRGTFVIPTSLSGFPSRYYPTDGAFGYGWSVDYASLTAGFMVSLVDWDGAYQASYSSDYGNTWTLFADQTPGSGGSGYPGGSMAAQSSSNLIWFPSNNGPPKYSHDGGSTWSSPTGLPAAVAGDTGFSYSKYNFSHTIACDRGDGTFYAYNYNTPGIYSSTDGSSWSLAYTGTPGGTLSTAAMRMRCPPKYTGGVDTTGHVWFAGGGYLGANAKIAYSEDHGATWTTLATIANVSDFAFGKPSTVSGTSYPTIFAWVNGGATPGLYISEDKGATWTQMCDENPAGSTDSVQSVGGDEDAYGVAFLGMHGSGFYLTQPPTLHHGGKGLRNF